MAITDYDSLKAEILVYTARSNSSFANRVETFVSLAEDRIFNGVGTPIDPMFSPPVRVKQMSVTTTIAIASSTGDVPANSLGLRRLSRTTDLSGLDYLAPDAFDRRYQQPDGGLPRWYTIEGDQVRVAPAGWSGDLNVVHYERPTAVSSSNQTNEILTNYPNLYLAATLWEAFSFMKDGDAANGWLARYRSAASGVNRSAESVRHGGGKLRSQPRFPIP